MQKSYVGFIFGGDSAESDVSVVTALGLEKQIRGTIEFEPVFIYISRQNKFYYVPCNLMNVDTFKNVEYSLRNYEVKLIDGGGVKRIRGLSKKVLFSLDAIVNCCHGGAGENGVLSGYLKMLNIPFSTASHLSLGLAMDKNLFKLVLRSSGILVPNWVYFSSNDYTKNKDEIVSSVIALRFPVIVKPNASGSSLGVTIVSSIEELDEAILVALEFDSSVIVEKLVQNKVEFNCAVLGGGDEIIVSDVDQIENNHDLFSFADKYIGSNENKNPSQNRQITKIYNNHSKKSVKGMESASRLIPAPISSQLTHKIQSMSAEVFKLLGLSGISRVDFLYDKKKKKLYVGEINSVPGSMALYFFSRSKLGCRGVISKLVQIAKNEYKRNKSVSEKFIPKIF